jgi:tRNA (guanine37-N1)-methyltransferase
MVMRADVWGSALDAVRGTGVDPPALVVPAPTGAVLTHHSVREFVHLPWVVIACGRYEGIDARVVEHFRDREDWAGVHEVSLGDYVVAGGEVAALVLVEAIGRLIPGVLGNDVSAAADSFAETYRGLLEPPMYTRPEEWRGIRVPEVLLSGNHARIEAWRHNESRRRTEQSRPSLLDPGTA